MGASIWTPGSSVPIVNADSTVAEQVFTANVAQTTFTLTDFVYTPATGSLAVYKDGIKLLPSQFSENSSTVFTLTTPCVGGEKIDAVGIIGSTASQSAEVSATASAASAAAALVSETNAAASATAASGSATNAAASALAASNSAAEAAGYASVGFNVASTIYDFGSVADAAPSFATDYGSIV